MSRKVPPSLLPTKSSSVSFVSIFTEFRGGAHISRGEGGRRTDGESERGSLEEKGEKEMEFAFLPHHFTAAAKTAVGGDGDGLK